jgi:hypothetical protein
MWRRLDETISAQKKRESEESHFVLKRDGCRSRGQNVDKSFSSLTNRSKKGRCDRLSKKLARTKPL